jgi:hypothetical protein
MYILCALGGHGDRAEGMCAGHEGQPSGEWSPSLTSNSRAPSGRVSNVSFSQLQTRKSVASVTFYATLPLIDLWRSTSRHTPRSLDAASSAESPR